MVNFKINGLPSIVNALIITSVLSAGNHCTYAAARTIHGLALDRKAPAFFAKCNKSGVPYYAVVLALVFCLLALLQLGDSSSTVLGWLVGICTASFVLNYVGTVITYLHFYKSLQRQGIDRNTLPYKGYFQPYAAYWALFGTVFMSLALGYNLFIDGQWDTTLFITSYGMVGLFPAAFIVWKLIKRTKYVWPGTADLQLGSTKSDIDLYETLYEPKQRGKISGWFNGLFE